MNILEISNQKEPEDKPAAHITFFSWIPAAFKFSLMLHQRMGSVIRSRAVLLFFSVIFLLSCTPTLSSDEYVKWVEDPKNGLRSLRKSGDLQFDLQFQPADYLWLQSGKAQGYENAVESNKATQHYLLRITSQDPEIDWLKSGYDLANYQRRVYYFSYLFQNDLSISENGAVLSCILYHFEQVHGGSYTKTFLIGFENRFPASETAVLTINSEYLNSLPINIKVSKNNLPNLKI